MSNPKDKYEEASTEHGEDHITKLADMNTQPDEAGEAALDDEDEDDDNNEGEAEFPGKPRKAGLPDETLAERD